MMRTMAAAKKKRAKPAKPANPLKGVVRALDDALHDEAVARRASGSRGFQRDVARDRRGTLSRFKTVQHALEDRERTERGSASARGRGRPPRG
jgi:hypothetical protein